MKQRQYNTMSDEKPRVNSSYSKVRKICFKTRVKAVPLSKALHKFNNCKIESKIIIHSYHFYIFTGMMSISPMRKFKNLEKRSSLKSVKIKRYSPLNLILGLMFIILLVLNKRR